MVANEVAAVLSPAAKKCGFKDKGYICYEEDAQESVVLRELLEMCIRDRVGQGRLCLADDWRQSSLCGYRYQNRCLLYTSATITRQQIGTVERALQICWRVMVAIICAV